MVNGDELGAVRERALDLNLLEHLGRDKRQRLGVVQLEAATAPAARHFGGREDKELLLLTRGEVHRRASSILTRRPGAVGPFRGAARVWPPRRRRRPWP